mmetsp:Transcript_57657/g.65791  ORF Transcript_57657/g.65791 Transcript_57657/m.65791 type:complete len:557 (-) Transcript_57657:232-1902(-)
MSHFLQPNVILLKEGTDTSQGKGQIVSNINACQVIADIVKTTLGPRGMDKLIHDGKKVIITNDGATVMKNLEIVHPAAKTLVDISKSQDEEVGDGTTSVVLLATSFLKEAKGYVEEGVHSQILIKGFRKALTAVLSKISEIEVKLDGERRDLLLKCAQTSLNSKLISNYKEFFAGMVVDAVEALDEDLDKSFVGIKKVPGGSVRDSFLVDGVAFKKTFSYAGFEQQPHAFKNPKILCLNIELELKAEKENAEIRIENPDEYQSIVDAEWNIIYEKLDKIVQSGAQVVLSKLPIGDLATQYFADRNIFCAGRVPEEDLQRVCKASGAQVQTSVNKLNDEVLGTCGDFEEKQVGPERYNLFKDCPSSKTATIVLRGGAEQFIDETERSLNDAIMIVRRAFNATSVVAGGGAIEMELSRYLRHYATSLSGKLHLIVNSYAKALEVIPRTIAENCGFDSNDIMNKLRQKHAQGTEGRWFGVDLNSQDICNTYESFVWEPSMMKINALTAATEACCVVLSVDETVKNPTNEEQQGGRGRGGRGMPGRGGMGMPRGGMPRRR